MSVWSDLLDRVLSPSWELAYQRGFEDGADAVVLTGQVSSGEVAMQIGRALWHTKLTEVTQAAVITTMQVLGIPVTPEQYRSIDNILRGVPDER